MGGWYTPIKGKCTWWREALHDDDAHNMAIKIAQKRTVCMCMVEGRGWSYMCEELPIDCPESIRCRYHIKAS